MCQADHILYLRACQSLTCLTPGGLSRGKGQVAAVLGLRFTVIGGDEDLFCN